MGVDLQSGRANGRRLSNRKNTVKTGCRTCKTRKIKCDEGRPACRRCVSTGRICDGYGIWGGGGNFYGQREKIIAHADGSVILWPPARMSILAADAEERQYFEWFKWRAVKKIPGYFILPFWDTLIFQTCENEPAVLHAVLTLSSTHKMEVFDGSFHRHGNDSPDRQEQFMLQQYVKATNHLRPHLSAKDKSSTRISLIACVLFVATELFRGRFQSAQTHLLNGLRIMREMYCDAEIKTEQTIIQARNWNNSVDEWIWDALSRFQLQISLFKQSHEYPDFAFRYSLVDCSFNVFSTRNSAWEPLQSIFNQILCLAAESRSQQPANLCLDEGSSLMLHQNRIQKELANWLEILKRSRKCIQEQDSEGLLYQLLRMYHEMAKIMAATSLSPEDETAFDRETPSFIALIEQATEMWKPKSCLPRIVTWPNHLFNMAGSVIDMGWIPPLYYAALKCRVHRVRMHAIRLLEISPHREGFWDARIAAVIARRVTVVEERGFGRAVERSDDFLLTSSPNLSSCTLPVLPDSFRMYNIKVQLPEGPEDRVVLSWKQRTMKTSWQEFTDVYDLKLQNWMVG